MTPLSRSADDRSVRQSLDDRWLWPFFVVFYAVLSNLPFWAAKHWFGFFHNGWFCVEYATVGLLALVVPRFLFPRVLVPLLLFLVIIADVVAAVCETYFLMPEDCLQNAGALHELPGSRLLILFAVFSITALILAVAAWLPVKSMSRSSRKRAALSLVVFIVACSAVDAFILIRREGRIPNPLHSRNRSDAVSGSYFGELRVTRRTFLRLLYLEVNRNGLSLHNMSFHAPDVSIGSAFAVAAQRAGLFNAHDPGHSPNVVLVLLESWGQAMDPAMRASFVQPYAQTALLAKYQVIQGEVPFYGPTLGGEGRELCGSKIGFHLLTAKADALQPCIPDRLAAIGYHTIASHGLDGNMFSRSDWYDRIGFKERWFQPQFLKLGLPNCVGAFIGICDASIADWIGQRLTAKNASPDFIYWVSLNSHLPVLLSSHLPNPLPCSLTAALATHASLCSWYQLVANVHQSVAAAAMRPSSRPTVFVIVGDHAPPFVDAELRSEFSGSDVPYVVLIPRQDGAVEAVPAQR